MPVNRELATKLNERNGDIKVERIISTLRPIALKSRWSVEELSEVALTVADLIHASEMQLVDTVEELLRDSIGGPR